MPKKNILWIVATQWRAQACGYAGDPNARTPCLDRLAAESIDFTAAVTPHPFGPFARAAMLTGAPSPENGVRDYFDPLPEDARTIAHRMAEAGRSTAFFGKWHLARRDPSAPLVGEPHARMSVPPPARGGFEFWEGFESGFLLNDPWLQGTQLPEPTQFKGYQSDVLCGRTAAWIRARTNPTATPFFCVVSLEPPHPPYDAPAAGIAARDPREIILPANVPRGGDAEAKARRELSGYYAHLEATDRAIGRLIPGLPPETFVVFTSVHGDMHGAHGLFRKGWPYEESVRVPLLVRGPEMAPGRNEKPVSLLDLYRWSLDWAEGKDAANRGQRLTDPISRAISMPGIVRLPHQCDRVWTGIRMRARKLILNAAGRPWLFFDLERDPLEMQNLVEDETRAGEIAAVRNWMKVSAQISAHNRR